MMLNIKILKIIQEVLPYQDQIVDAVDKNKKIFGFMQKEAYSGIIKSGKLWVAVDEDGNYVGHVLYGGKEPLFVRIFQIFVAEKFRNKGIAGELIAEIRKYAEEKGCLSLEAHIAEDLKDSIKFYKGEGFYKICEKKEANKSGRKIFIFSSKLTTPSLLPEENFNISIAKNKLNQGVADHYVLDLNILFELLHKRNQADLVKQLLKASHSNEFKLSVTPEFIAELQKHPQIEDPMLAILGTLPLLRKVDDSKL